MSQVFLSYSRQDQAEVLKIRESLERRGIDVWIDQDDIGTGSRWDIQIEEGIQKSKVIVVVVSPASVESSNVGDEWSFALENDKHIIPVLLEDCNVPMRIASLQRIEFTDGFDDGVSRLIDAILEVRQVSRQVEKKRRNFQPQKIIKTLKIVAMLAIIVGGGFGGYITYQNKYSTIILEASLIGQDRTRVEQMLSDNFISVATVFVEHTTGDADTVYKINPPVGSHIERFSAVELYVVAQKVQVPNVIAMPKTEAINTLEAAGFAVQLVRAPELEAEIGTVFEVQPVVGSLLTKGQKVVVQVAEKSGWIYLENGNEGDIVTLSKGFKLRKTTDSSNDSNIVDRLSKGTPVKIYEAFNNGWRRVRVINASDV